MAGRRLEASRSGASVLWLVPVAAATALAKEHAGGALAQVVAWCAAFQIALLGFATLGDGVEDGARDGARMVAGLLLAACCCRVGWAAMQGGDGASLTGPAGFSVLFAPIGPWLSAPRRRARRRRFLRCAFGGLPLAIASARIGCIAVGCCGGVSHPTQLYEAAGCAALSFSVGRLPARLVAPAVFAGLAAVRIAVDPLRAPSPFGAPRVPAVAVAFAMLVAGVAAALLAWRRQAEPRGEPA